MRWALAAALLVAGCGLGDEPIGSPCVDRVDCASGFCLQEERYDEPTGWTGGYCSDLCGGTCPEGSSCQILGEDTVCLVDCEVTADCRDGYVCHSVALTCLPSCLEGWDCGDEQICGIDGYCIPPLPEITEPPELDPVATGDEIPILPPP